MSLLSTLGWIWTGCCFITRDCPHLLPCTGRQTRQFSSAIRATYLFQSGTISPRRAAPLRWCSHPAAALFFFEEPQQETIHSAALCSAEGRQQNRQEFFSCLYYQPQVISAEIMLWQVT